MTDKQNTAALHASLDLRGVLEAIENEDWPAIVNLQRGISDSVDELEEAFDLD